MFTNSCSKKAIVLACLGISVYLFSIVTIAQTAEKTGIIVLTPDAMAQILGGGSCSQCVPVRESYSDSCESHACQGNICSQSYSMYIFPEKECAGPWSSYLCYQWDTGNPDYVRYYCECEGQTNCNTDWWSGIPSGDQYWCDYDYSTYCV